MGETEAVFAKPVHPYTKALFASAPQPIPGRVKNVPALSGEIGDPLSNQSWCRFSPRCDQTLKNCLEARCSKKWSLDAMWHVIGSIADFVGCWEVVNSLRAK